MQPDLLNRQLKLPKGVKGAETTRPSGLAVVFMSEELMR